LEDFIDNLWRAIITHNFMVFKFQFAELNIAYMAVWFSKEIRRLFLF
jgi:hypothetical protein